MYYRFLILVRLFVVYYAHERIQNFLIVYFIVLILHLFVVILES